MEQQQRDLIQHQEARADPKYRAQEQQVHNPRHQQVCAGRQASFRALNYQPDTFVTTTSVGLLSIECKNCDVLKFSKETEGSFCSKGNVKLDAFPQPQPFLKHLYEGTDSDGKHFLSSIIVPFKLPALGVTRSQWLASTHHLEYRVRFTI